MVCGRRRQATTAQRSALPSCRLDEERGETKPGGTRQKATKQMGPTDGEGKNISQGGYAEPGQEKMIRRMMLEPLPEVAANYELKASIHSIMLVAPLRLFGTASLCGLGAQTLDNRYRSRGPQSRLCAPQPLKGRAPALT